MIKDAWACSMHGKKSHVNHALIIHLADQSFSTMPFRAFPKSYHYVTDSR